MDDRVDGVARSAASGEAMFDTRAACIACGATSLETVAEGCFHDPPLRDFLANDPWGTSPLPQLEHERWQLSGCRDCGQLFHGRVLSPPWLKVLFTEWMTDGAIKAFEETHGVNRPERVFESARGKVRHVLRLEKLTRGERGDERMRVLDFGCGWGGFLVVAAMFGAETYGIDLDEDRRHGAEGMGVCVVPGLAELDPSLRGRLHVVTLFQVLEHLIEPLAVLRELRTWIAPHGVLVLETPDCSGVRGFSSTSDYRAINPLSHINAFTPRTLAAIARRAGFRPERRIPAHATADVKSVAKTEAGRILQPLAKSTTNLYFRAE